MGSAEAKGINFFACLDMLEARHGGGDARTAALAALDPDLSERLRNGALIHAGWYPVAWYDALLAAAQQVVPPHDLGVLEQLGQAGVARDMRGIYRLLVKLISPQTLLSWGPRTFGHYYRGGSVTVLDSQPGRFRVQYAGWGDFTERLWHSVLGGSYAALAACGAREVAGSVVKLGPRSAAAEMAFSWRS